MDQENYILELSNNYISFDSVKIENAVFYDENNRQIFVVKQRGSGGVIVKGPDIDFCNSFSLEDKGEIFSIKFSINFEILAIQRSTNCVNFINFCNTFPADQEYSQSCKAKSRIIGFVWTSNCDIFFVTNNGLEFYHINKEKKECKLSRSFKINVSWYVFQSSSSLLLLASGTYSNVFQPIHFHESQMLKLKQFEVDLNLKNEIILSSESDKQNLCERDVSFIRVYGKTYLLILRHNNNNQEFTGSYIVLYMIEKESQTKLTNILQLFLTGKFAINVIDDIIIVHHQTSQTSLLFDINQPEVKKKGYVLYHNPLVPPYTIKPFRIKDNISCELYSTNWVIYQPNIIIDAKLGCLWTLQINLLPLCRMLSNKIQLFEFLIFRKNSKNVLLNLCNKAIIRPTYELNDNSLSTISFLFNKLNKIYKEKFDQSKTLDNKAMSNNFSTSATYDNKKKCVVIDQNELFQFVFSAFEIKDPQINDDLIIAILFDYINSLIYYSIPIQFHIYELLINLLVRNEKYFQLHQFLQYHVFTDSKPLACLILSLNKKYPPALQLCLDMFKRLNANQEYLIDIFLSKMDILRAIRFLNSNQILDSVSAKKYLEFSLKSSDKQLFFSVFQCFQERNFQLRGSKKFAIDEQCDEFVQYFKNNF